MHTYNSLTFHSTFLPLPKILSSHELFYWYINSRNKKLGRINTQSCHPSSSRVNMFTTRKRLYEFNEQR